MLKLQNVHHIAILCSDYDKSKRFYTKILGFKLERENFRVERNSWKADLSLNGKYIVELFSFPNPPARVSRPEACGLRHLAFTLSNLEVAVEELNRNGVKTEPIRTDEFTGKRFCFFADPDDLPIELYEE
jgi:glyoxylase I family protein